MKNDGKASLFAVAMLGSGLPCSYFILIFLGLMAARDTGHPQSGDALGLMMMSLAAYALALLSCAAGAIYFSIAALKHNRFPRTWQWMSISYSLGQVVLPPIYFSVT